jgi:bifunctional UDP-N-acetylglucosamine pyrophosphorylase/glucosamine-1-phosphate N-acetyltransferase
MIGIVLVDDVTTPGPYLCGRRVADWLLDTVEALSPVSLEADSGPLRDRIALRPALDRALRMGRACDTTLVLPLSAPLLRPATLRRLVSSLAAGSSAAAASAAAASAAAASAVVASAVVAELVRPVPWWAESAAAGPAVFAVAGPPALARVGIPAACIDPALAGQRLAAAGVRVSTIRVDGVETLWLNDPADRVAAANALYARIAAGWLARGVVIEDPATTRIDSGVRIGAGARIRANTELVGDTAIGARSVVGPTTTVRDSRVGEDCQVHYSVCQDIEVGDGANIGPFAWLRSGSSLGDRCRAGAFVEVADSVVGAGTEIPHLAGLFSADVGRNCNVASMSGSLNYNGGQKRRTRIGDDVSIGSGSILIAPISIGDKAETAAGSVITEDVPSGALAVSRTPQRNITGWSAVRSRPIDPC